MKDKHTAKRNREQVFGIGNLTMDLMKRKCFLNGSPASVRLTHLNGYDLWVMDSYSNKIVARIDLRKTDNILDKLNQIGISWA